MSVENGNLLSGWMPCRSKLLLLGGCVRVVQRWESGNVHRFLNPLLLFVVVVAANLSAPSTPPSFAFRSFLVNLQSGPQFF